MDSNSFSIEGDGTIVDTSIFWGYKKLGYVKNIYISRRKISDYKIVNIEILVLEKQIKTPKNIRYIPINDNEIFKKIMYNIQDVIFLIKEYMQNLKNKIKKI